MRTSEFDYALPPALIAQVPLPDRAASRMLVVRREDGRLEDRHVSDLPDYLRGGDVLVVNDTRVFPARVYGERIGTGGKVELLLVEERPGAASRGRRDECRVSAESKTGSVEVWTALLRCGFRPRPKMKFRLAGGHLAAEVLSVRGEGKITVRLQSERPLMEVLDRHGFAPTPPYIKRAGGQPSALADLDRERYQTVYARATGAVAAPTAGLHFTPELLARLRAKGVLHAALTLHVGPGTFRPVQSESVEDHRMEPERYVLPADSAESIRRGKRAGGRTVAVGTTVARVLETVVSERGALTGCEGRSSLFICPPYAFRAVDAMLTNFHLPRSTLLMMVCAFAGKDLVFRAYREAIRREYRFYSYGDCMLVV